MPSGGRISAFFCSERDHKPKILKTFISIFSTGHPPADPRILLALWLYATVEGIGSAREVARLCDEHIAVEWLCGGVGMNAKTLADFRVDHGAVLERLLVDSFTALVRAGVASLDRV
jgi:transposase